MRDKKKITKVDILDSIYQKTGMNRKEAREVIDLFLGDIKSALVKGTTVELRGFGTFEARVRKGRLGARNPKTGAPVAVNSHGIAAFRPGRELKRDIWNLPDAVSDAAPDPAAADVAGDRGQVPQSGAL
jgi:integration host factor subunit beta